MANINVSEKDFEALATAANDAKLHGDLEQAEALDKLARKVNAALSNAKHIGLRNLGGIRGKNMTWQEAPSTLIP